MDDSTFIVDSILQLRHTSAGHELVQKLLAVDAFINDPGRPADHVKCACKKLLVMHSAHFP